jgi:hypothetical protein
MDTPVEDGQAAAVSTDHASSDGPEEIRVASVEESMRVVRMLATRHSELLRRLA